MKSILMSLMTLASISAFAEDMALDQHTKLLKLLVGKTGAVKADENRTYYFASQYGQVIELTNSKDNISLSLKPDDEQEPMTFALGDTANDNATVKISEANELALSVVTSFNESGSRKMFMSTRAGISSSTYGKSFVLGITAEQKSYWDYDTSNSDSSKWKWVFKKSPKVAKSEIQGQFVLSLSEKDTAKMGKMATAKVREKRDGGTGSCSMQSAYIMKCEWSLETERTPDTIRGVFSIKDGKISELLDVEMEPGC